MALPLVLQSMSTASREQLDADFTQWGHAVKGYSRPQIMEITGLSSARAERLGAWIKYGSRIEVAPTLVPANDGSERLAEPSTTYSQINEDEFKLVIEGNGGHPSAPLGQGVVRNLDELYEQANIDPRVWTTDGFEVSSWPTTMRLRKTGTEGQRLDDEIAVIRSWRVVAKFRRKVDDPVGETDWTGEPLRRQPRVSQGSTKSCLVVPDMHIGYAWAENHTALVPLHDWNAIDCMLQVQAMLQPDEIQNLGDFLDLAPFSRFDCPLALRDTTNPAIRTAYSIFRMQREISPGALFDVQGGNHDNRTERAHIGTEWDGLTSAKGKAPALSFATLCHLDELDITWRNYGDHRYLFGKVKIHHGDVIKSKGGLTVAKVIENSETSVGFGHIHRLEQASRTVWGPNGPRVRTAFSPGTLARTDGMVPGVSRTPDWQQGFAIVYYDEEQDQEYVELIQIVRGTCFFRGQRIVGRGAELAALVAKQVAYPQIVAGVGR